MKRLARQFKTSQDLRGEKYDQRENSLVENIQKKIAIMTYKCLNDLTSVYLKQFFKYSADVHGYNTRTAKVKKLHVSQKNNTWQTRTFKARAIEIWNALPASTTKQNSLLLFTTTL